MSLAYQKRLKHRAAVRAERRRRPRLAARPPVSFSASPSARVSLRCQRRVLRSPSQDVPLTGIQTLGQDPGLLGLPAGCRLRLQISLPHPWGVISGLGTLRNVAGENGSPESGGLSIGFAELPPDEQDKLERFLLNGS